MIIEEHSIQDFSLTATESKDWAKRVAGHEDRQPFSPQRHAPCADYAVALGLILDFPHVTASGQLMLGRIRQRMVVNWVHIVKQRVVEIVDHG